MITEQSMHNTESSICQLGTMLVVFALVCTLGIFTWKRALITVFTAALTNDAYTHILIVLPLSFLLLLTSRRRYPWTEKPAIGPGLVLLALSVLLRLRVSGAGSAGSSTVDPEGSLAMLAFVLWIIGAFILCFGKQAFRACMFPLLFLAWLIPLPDAALIHITHFLQQATASCAHVMLSTLGVPVIQHGINLTVPGLTVQVAEECSSIRSSMMLVVTATVMSYVLLSSSWARGIIILAALPLAIFKNGLRVLTLSILGAYISPGILDSPLHHQGGPLFFAVSLLGIFSLIWLIRKAESRAVEVTAS